MYLTGRGFALLSMYMSVLVALLRIRRNFVVRRYVGQRSLEGAAKVAALIHYDSGGKIYDFLVYYLEALRHAGFEIVFTSNSPKLDPDSLATILPLCALVLHRKNIGYDFGAYKDSLAELGDLSQFDEVILANDSVYGPLFDLKEVLEEVRQLCRCLGHDRQPGATLPFAELLSCCLARLPSRPVHGSVLGRSETDPIARVDNSQYEIGLTQAMLHAGVRCAASVPISRRHG